MNRQRKETDPTMETGMGRSRDAGVLLHVTSLPGPYGIGDLGPEAYGWVDALAMAGQRWWQILPLNPADEGGSPYCAFSAFAGNECLISPEMLSREGLLEKGDVDGHSVVAGRVNYRRVMQFKARLAARAWERFRGGGGRRLRGEFEKFRQGSAEWLRDYALFMAMKEAMEGRPWAQWPRGLALRRASALREAERELAGAIERHCFAQFLFARQWEQLRRHARARGVRILGDLPIFVSGESADVWARPELFQLDRERRPVSVAGVPPDYFSATGQRWGNPLYDWGAMRRDGYRWWIDRFRRLLEQVDAVRIDHFRGFEAYWSIPARARTAKTGRWVKAPGAEMFAAARRALGGLPFVAEDLGLITPAVRRLRDELGLPGMRVLQFAFGGGGDSQDLPHNHVRNAVVYTGTHDNDTTAGWFRSLDRRAKSHLLAYAPDAGKYAAEGLLRLAWGSVADHAIAPMQDVLGLGREARMNLPGTAKGNWGWRLRGDQRGERALDRLAELPRVYGRWAAGTARKAAAGVGDPAAE